MLHYNVYDSENSPLNVEVGKTDATTGNITIPAQVTHDGTTYNVVRTCDYAFLGCENLTGITFSEGLVQINGASFEGCKNLASVSLPSTLNSIGGYAFNNCVSLKNLVIPGSVEFPDVAWLFAYCEFDKITFEASNVALPSNLEITAKNVVLNRNGGRFYGVETVVVGGLATEVSESAFSGCRNLTSVTINDNVTRIGDYAFYGTEELVTVTINSPLETIGTAGFQYCRKLANIEFPSTLTTIGDGAFYYCEDLKELTIPANVSTIGGDAFGYCTFDNLTIEDCSTSLNLGSYSLNAHNAYVGRPMTSERGELFYDSYFTGTLEIGGNVTTLTTQYAKNLNIMTKLILGNSVQTIENEALNGCSSLADMYVPWQTPLAINENVFKYDGSSILSQNATLWVPAGKKNAYQTATGWNLFDNIQPTHYIVTLATEGNGTVTLDGKTSGNVLVAYDATNIDFVLAVGEDYDFASLNDGTSNVYTPASQGATKNGGTYTLSSISDDMTFTATFTEKPKFTITAIATGGTATASAAQVYRDRDAYVTFAANEGHELTAVTLNEADVLAQVADNRLNLTNIQANQNVVATFTRIHYSISKDETTNGTIVLAATDVQWGDNTTATITPATGYDIDHVTINGENADAQLNGNILTISNVKANTVVGATFKKHAYTISANATENGTIVLASTSVLYQEGTTATITPATGYDINEVTINGADAKSQLNGNTLTISNVTQNTVVAATFKKHAYTISAAATTNGTITLDATSVLYQEGTTATITPASGYMVETVTINGGENLYNSPAFNKETGVLTISNVTANTTVAATFRIQSYVVTINDVDVTADNMYPQHGQSVTFTIANNTDRELTSFMVNGSERIGSRNGNTITVTANSDLNVVATFRSLVETIRITAASGASTFCCDQDLNFNGSELRAYIAVGCKDNGDGSFSVLLSRVYDVPSGTGLYIVGTTNETYKIPYTSSHTHYMNMMVGNISGASLPITSLSSDGTKANYYLKNGAFLNPSGTTNIGNKKAYLQMPLSFYNPTANAKITVVFEEDMTDGIEDFIMFDQRGNDRIYNLNGQQVNKAGKGVYIVNGKKVLNK